MTDFIVRYRWAIIAVSVALAVGLGLLIPSSETDPDIRNYIPRNMDSRVTNDSIEQAFGVQDMIMVLFTDTTILKPGDLRQVREIDRAFSRMEGIGTVNSVFTARKIEGRDGMMVVDPLIERIPESDEGLESLRQDILANAFARDIVVSSDMTSAAITGTINTNVSEYETLSKIDSVIAESRGDAGILTGGLPYIRQFITSDVNHDALVLIPVALIIMLTVLKLSLGNWRSVFIPFTVVILSTLVTMGMIPLLGWKFSIIMCLAPIILISVANNYGIYLVTRHQELSKADIPMTGKETVRAITGSLNMPILFSGLTTVAGLLGLLTHSIIPARQVGILAATGVTLALAMSLLLIPALIYMQNSPRRKPRLPQSDRNDLITRALAKISSVVIRWPGRVVLVSFGLTLLLGIGVIFLRIETNQENFFPHKHPVRKAAEIINSKFGGSQTISVMISGDIKDPVVMQKIDDLTRHLKSSKGVGSVFSISDVVREMSKALYEPTEEGYDMIPLSGEAIAQMFELYNMSGNPDDFKQLMNFENTKAHLLVRLSHPDNKTVKNLRVDIKSYTADFPAKVTTGGYAFIMNDFSQKIINGQVSSLVFALIVVLILLAIIFRSVKGGLTGSIPLAASILIQFGVMGLTGVAIDAATALLSSIMIGVGVDFTIQFLWRYKIELEKGISRAEAILATYRTTGRSIVINALSVMAGFSATFISGFLSIRFFGYLTLLAIGSCLLYAIIVMPAFMLYFKPSFVESDQKTNNKNRRNNEKDLIPLVSSIAAVTAGHAGAAVRSRATDG
ncbi:MAG: MMPL family transporter [Bacteroidales bacterium]|jgi:hydrophobe/amphiphile efflux-3 (HAE3) family protein|nr:MMPL family transporter [Bacteroidales bacterium]